MLASGRQIFSPDQIQQLLSNAPTSKGRYKIKLYILLGLNCGFTQADLASLETAHIIFDDTGSIPVFIRRQRQKTGVESQWKLWGQTADLLTRALNEKLNKDGDIIFHTQQGNRLDYKRLSLPVSGKRFSGTKMIQSQTVQGRFRYLSNSTFPNEDDLLSFKYLRKTVATMIRKLDINNSDRIAQTYLSHGRPSTADRHYLQQDYASLNSALDRLEEELGLVE